MHINKNHDFSNKQSSMARKKFVGIKISSIIKMTLRILIKILDLITFCIAINSGYSSRLKIKKIYFKIIKNKKIRKLVYNKLTP